MKRDYFALWGLLATAFIIFLGISVFGDEVSIGSSTWRTSGMASEIFGEDCLAKQPDMPERPKALDGTDTSKVAKPAKNSEISEPAKITEPSDSSKASEAPDSIKPSEYTVLFIGDSMLEGLGPRLAAYCEASGYKLYNVIWYSSTSEIWGNARLLTSYIKRVKPNFIFICLGANELSVKDIASKRDKHVKSILAEAGNIPYLWIGPPNWKPDTGINDLVRDNAPEGRFFQTNGMKFDRQKDGAHPTYESAIAWMDSVMRWMPDHCPQAPKFTTPDKKKGKATRQFVHRPGKKP